jgi:hypothetical protein
MLPGLEQDFTRRPFFKSANQRRHLRFCGPGE